MSIDRAIKVTTKLKNKFYSPEIANKIVLAITLVIAMINSHFLIFVRLVDFASITYDNETYSQNYSQETTILNVDKSIKACYGDPTTTYFVYLTNYFPWYS